VNTYAEPVLLLSPYAPITAVSPYTETENPNWSFAAPSLAFSYACCVHVLPLRVNTYAEPLLPCSFAPITAVSPYTETENPK